MYRDNKDKATVKFSKYFCISLLSMEKKRDIIYKYNYTFKKLKGKNAKPKMLI